MVRLYYLAVIQRDVKKNNVLSESFDLADFNFFRRSGVREFMRFSCCVLAGRQDLGSKVSVREQIYVCHVFVRNDNLAAAAVTDDEYPHIAIHKCLEDLLNEFSRRRKTPSPGKAPQYQEIKELMQKYKEPKHVDCLTTVQNELEETSIILYETLQSVLKRGENLDELVVKTDELSAQAKVFYKTARKTNSCCTAF